MANQPLGFFFASTIGILIFIVLIFWTLLWKGLALWKAARSNDKSWYIVILVINTVGILEILYYYIFSKKEK